MAHRAAENSESASTRVPEKSITEWGVALLLFVVSCLYLRLFYDYTVLNADEGIVLQGAQRILQGQVLYRDFFSFLTPGSYYWMALLFKIFGSTILVGRAALIVYGGLFSVLTYLLARRVCSRWSALLASYMVTLSCLPFRFVALHNWDSTLLAYLTLYCAVLWLEQGHWAWALGTGSFSSLTLLFVQSKGAGLALGLLAGFMVIRFRGRCGLQFQTPHLSRQAGTPSLLGRGQEWRVPALSPGERVASVASRVRGLCPPQAEAGGNTQDSRELPDGKQLAALAVGLAWPLAVTFTYFAMKHSVPVMLTDWVWPLFHYSRANILPYGYLVMSSPDPGALFRGSWSGQFLTLLILGPCILLPVLPIVAIGIFIWFALRPSRGELAARPWGHVVLASALLCGLLSSTFLTKRADFTHLNYLGPLFYLVFAWVLDGLNLQSRLWRSVKPLVVFFAFLSYTAFGMALLWGPLGAAHKLRTARGTIRTAGPEVALEYLQARITPGERILIYPYQPLYYYLTAASSVTRFDFLQPGMHTSDQFQEAMLQLATERPRVVLFEPDFNEKIFPIWPNTAIAALGARDPVQDYIVAHYRACTALAANGFWHFVFMVRNDGDCPKDDAESRE